MIDAIVAFLELAGQPSLLDNLIVWAVFGLIMFGVIKLGLFVLYKFIK